MDELITCTSEAKNCQIFTRHTKVHSFYGTYSRLQLLKIARTRFGHYFLTFRNLLTVRQGLGAMVISDEWDDLSIDRDGMHAPKETIFDN